MYVDVVAMKERRELRSKHAKEEWERHEPQSRFPRGSRRDNDMYVSI